MANWLILLANSYVLLSTWIFRDWIILNISLNLIVKNLIYLNIAFIILLNTFIIKDSALFNKLEQKLFYDYFMVKIAYNCCKSLKLKSIEESSNIR